MSRAGRSDVETLIREARAVELVTNEAEIVPERLPLYWDLSADLIALVTDIDEMQVTDPDAEADQFAMLALRRRLREVVSRLADLQRE